MSSAKRASSPAAGPSKRSRPDAQPAGPRSLHAWLHPDQQPPLVAHSPPLHSSSSTFVSFSVAFTAPAHVTSTAALTKEAKRMVRELDVVALVGDEIMEGNDGAFQDGQGRVASTKGKERAREPDHRMWAVRTLALKEGRDGTKGEDDYQLLQVHFDDGEKYGGERVLRVMQEERAVDVLTACCRWYGGDMIGPVRFQHIGLTAKTSLQDLGRMTTRRDLCTLLESLDSDIYNLRQTISRSPPAPGPEAEAKRVAGKYDAIEEIAKLERLVLAREKTKAALESRVGWDSIERVREGGA